MMNTVNEKKQTLHMGHSGYLQVNGTEITMVEDMKIHLAPKLDERTKVTLEFYVDEVVCAWGHMGEPIT